MSLLFRFWGGDVFVNKLIKLVIILALSLTALFLLGRDSIDAAPPANFQTTQIIGSGLDSPSGFAFAPDGRIFILQRAGKVMVYKNGALLPNPFVDLPSEASGDRGLIGIAFDPDFVNNHFVYFYYTSSGDLLNRIVRFDASGDTATSNGTVLFMTSDQSFQLHVGGSLVFGPDGKLYFAVGDNGVPDNAQDLSNPHGKILRINKDGTVPTDNPFFGQAGKYGAIWAYGFRNPWRFNFDPANGRLYVGDVGEATWEEIDLVQKGANYGWPIVEGPCTINCSFTAPIYYYNHNLQSAAVTLGPVYRANMFPSVYQGKLFFGDYAQGFIKTLGLDANGNSTGANDFDLAAGSVVDFKIAPDGSLYYITYIPGRLYRISYSVTNHTPIANSSADVKTGTAPLTVHFSSSGTSDPDNDPLTYSWDFGDGTKSTDPNPTKTYANNGTYTVELTVSDGVNTAQAVPLVITVGIPPTISIGSPQDGTKYKAGDTISYTASAVGGNGQDLQAGAISTDIIFHHQTHIHPFLDHIIGYSGSFTTPITGEDSAETWFEIKVSATDSNNLTSSKSVNVYPYTSVFTLNTNPAGLQLYLDGTQINAPAIVTGVVNFQRELKAPLIQSTGGKNYQFHDWSDGGAIKHTISTPQADTTYTANFQEMPAFAGEYFNNRTLSGTPTLARNDSAINFDWGGGSPDPLINVDNFSARWIKNQYFSAGNYQFTTSADDGVRLYIDGNLVLDKWIDQANTTYNTTVALTSGDHAIKMEYYENGGQALAKLSWDIVYDTTPQPGIYQAQYFNNMSLSGTPIVSRNESDINFNWGSGSPDAAINPDNFSARFVKTDTFTDGTYEFTLTADDGARLYIDNNLILDKWIDQPATTYKVSKVLTAGQHDIKLEYYENGGQATVVLNYAKTGVVNPPTGVYQGSYWNTGTGAAPQIPNTAPNLQRADADINFDWGSGSPDPAINADHFVTRWTQTIAFDAATYHFSTISDDGIRLYVDNVLVIDQWNDHGSTTYSADINMTQGIHDIKLEYYEDGGGAVAKFGYAKTGVIPPTTGNGLTADYFNNMDLTAKVLTRTDQTVNFDWGSGSPDAAIGPDTFSVRWTGQVQTNFTEPYVFTASTDDGVRVWVNDTLIIDKWVDQGLTPTSGIINLFAGQKYNIKMEYYENGGGAAAMLFWSSPSTPNQIIPTGSLFTTLGSSTSYTGSYWNAGTGNAPAMPTVLPDLVRADTDINFDWGSGSPDLVINPDHFIARWVARNTFDLGTYHFTTLSDDGIRLYIDNVLVIDQWNDHGSTTYTADVNLTQGNHDIKLEYYEDGGGAVAKFGYAKL
jgi:glucose/arabinose dehydrogenase